MNDTFSILQKTITDQELSVDKNKLESVLRELYNDAINAEV